MSELSVPLAPVPVTPVPVSNARLEPSAPLHQPRVPGRRIRRVFGLNPVFARELRERVRRPGTPILLTIYLVLLLVVASFAYRSVRGNVANGFDGGFLNRSVAGRQMFEWVLFALFALVCFFVPGYTAGTITGERERQTMVPLQVTLLRPRQIVVGKILASVAYTVLLVVAAFPILCLAYAIGGLTVGQLVRGLFGVLFVALVLATLAVMWSAVFRRSATAIVMSYATVLVLLLGTPLLAAIFGTLGGSSGSKAVLLLNPFVFVADFVVMPSNDFPGFGFDGAFSATATSYRNSTDFFASPWIVSGLLLTLLSVLAFLLAKRRLRLPAERER